MHVDISRSYSVGFARPNWVRGSCKPCYATTAKNFAVGGARLGVRKWVFRVLQKEIRKAEACMRLGKKERRGLGGC